MEPSPFAWIGAALDSSTRLQLSSEVSLPLLARYTNPAVERSGQWRAFWSGRYGRASWQSWGSLTWSTNSCGSVAPTTIERLDDLRWGAFALLTPKMEAEPPLVAGLPRFFSGFIPPDAPAPELLAIGPVAECPHWPKRHPVTFLRADNERDTFHLLECDGSISPEAIDRLSVLARPHDVPRPSLPLSPEPAPDAASGEWVPGVKLVHPRLVWALHRIASAYPYRPIYVVSGYRPHSGRSYHGSGRAFDIQIVGVPNERVFALCRELADVGCGYYPNNRFVHVDVRPFGAGHPFWIDTARPGEPSHYVDSWPGVVDGGGLVYAGEP